MAPKQALPVERVRRVVRRRVVRAHRAVRQRVVRGRRVHPRVVLKGAGCSRRGGNAPGASASTPGRAEREDAINAATFEPTGTDSVTLTLGLAGGASVEVGPFARSRKELERPGALYSMTCADGLQVRAIPQGGRIVVAKAPPANTTWETIWEEPLPEPAAE